jgi:hypothetical protein
MTFFTRSMLSLFLFFFTSLSAYQYDFAVASLFRDEARFLKEWIEFHRLLGVQHFYLYNHLSKDGYMEVLQPYIDAGIVELSQITTEITSQADWSPVQVGALNDAVNKARGKVKWLAILDSDEFLFPTNSKQNLVQFFNQHYDRPNIGGVRAFWLLFGTSDVPRIPDDKLMIEMLVRCDKAGDNHAKHIVRPERVQACRSSHYCTYLPGYRVCSGSGAFSPPSLVDIDSIRLNHYFYRDVEFLNNVKIPRRKKWYPESMKNPPKHDATTDSKILRYVPALRARMGLEK